MTPAESLNWALQKVAQASVLPVAPPAADEADGIAMLEAMTKPPAYEFQGFYIPERMMGAIRRYVDHGIPPGHFLTAVLSNDLREAVNRVDDENLRNLAAYVAYFYNEAPSGCWGSPEKVKAWIAKFAAAGEEARQ